MVNLTVYRAPHGGASWRMTMIYGFGLDFDGGERVPPKVFIGENGGAGTVVAQVFEEPTHRGGGRLVERRSVAYWRGPWSNDPADWEPGPLARRMLAGLNQDGDVPDRQA